jgi:hypothetical protein
MMGFQGWLERGSLFSTKSSKNNYSHDRSTANCSATNLFNQRLVVNIDNLKRILFKQVVLLI